MKTFLTILITAAIAATATWFLRTPKPDGTSTLERKPLYYQSAMHPWIKSDRPGRCTICGMQLTPIYPGDKGYEDKGEGLVTLSESQVRVLNVQTSPVSIQPLSRTVEVAGMIDDDASRHRLISAYIDGRVDKLHVNYLGAEVTADQPLAEFYSPSLLQTEREYRQLSGELKINTGLRLRQMGLTREQVGAVDAKSPQQLTSQILSPIGGTVVGQDVYEGQYVTTGQKLFEIADFSTMWFLFEAYEQDLPWIRAGQTVVVRTPSLPGKRFEGKVTFIDPNFDESTRTTKIRVELPNPLVNGRRELLHKLYASATLKVESTDVLTVPRTAIMETSNEPVAYVDKGGGAYEQRHVRIGRRGDGSVEILEGLKAGEKVVTHGTLLIDGQAELDRSFAGIPSSTASSQHPIGDAQASSILTFVRTEDAMATALAADDLAAFNKASEPLMKQTGELIDSLGDRVELTKDLSILGDSCHFHGFDKLPKARAAFLKFTTAATNVLLPLRHEGAPAFSVFECPMVSEAIPGATKKGRWIQLPGRPGQNPFFGSAMLECGEEIKP